MTLSGTGYTPRNRRGERAEESLDERFSRARIHHAQEARPQLAAVPEKPLPRRQRRGVTDRDIVGSSHDSSNAWGDSGSPRWCHGRREYRSRDLSDDHRKPYHPPPFNAPRPASAAFSLPLRTILGQTRIRLSLSGGQRSVYVHHRPAWHQPVQSFDVLVPQADAAV